MFLPAQKKGSGASGAGEKWLGWNELNRWTMTRMNEKVSQITKKKKLVAEKYDDEMGQKDE